MTGVLRAEVRGPIGKVLPSVLDESGLVRTRGARADFGQMGQFRTRGTIPDALTIDDSRAIFDPCGGGGEQREALRTGARTPKASECAVGAWRPQPANVRGCIHLLEFAYICMCMSRQQLEIYASDFDEILRVCSP